MRKVLFYVGVVWLLAGLPCLAFGVQQWRADRHFATAGRHIVGVVLSTARQTGSTVSRGYHVSYQFTTPERVIVTNEATMSRSAHRALDKGGPIDVVYLPEDPNQSRARGEYSMVWVTLPMGIVFTGIGVVCLGIGIRETVFEARMRRHGVLTEATVTGVVRANVQVNRVWQARVGYQFRDEFGNSQEGQSPLMSEPDAALWTAGRRVYVKYDRTRPATSMWLGPDPE